MLQISPAHPDYSVVTAVQAGEWGAFEMLITTYSSELIRMAHAIIQNHSDAEDAVQDVFTWLWTNRKNWNPSFGVRLYLLRAAANRARDIKEKRDNRARLEEIHVVPSSEANTSAITDAEVGDAELWNTIATLPDRWREAIMLRYVENLPFAEVGLVMGISEDAAKKLVRRALAAVREEIEG